MSKRVYLLLILYLISWYTYERNPSTKIIEFSTEVLIYYTIILILVYGVLKRHIAFISDDANC